MNKRKHFGAFIGLLVIFIILGVLTYGVLFDIIWVEMWIATVITISWIFVMCLVIGFALAFPKRKKERPVPSNVEEPVSFEPIKEKDEEVKREGLPELTITSKEDESKLPVFTEVKDKVDEGIVEKTDGRPVDSDIGGEIEKTDDEPNIKGDTLEVNELEDKSFKILIKDLPHAIEIMKKIGITVEGKDGLHWIEIEPYTKEEKKEDFIISIKSHVDDLNDEAALKIDKLFQTEDSAESVDLPQESLRQRVRKHLKNNPETTSEDLAKKFNITIHDAAIYIKKYNKSQAYLKQLEKDEKK